MIIYESECNEAHDSQWMICRGDSIVSRPPSRRVMGAKGLEVGNRELRIERVKGISMCDCAREVHF